MPKAARRRARAVPHNAPSGNDYLWFPVGPTSLTNGQAGGDPNVAGRIRDLAVDPTDGKRVYAATAGGGVWFSADAGASWRPLDEWQISDRGTGRIANALACGAIFVGWGTSADGSGDLIWVGTGEPDVANYGGPAGGGETPGGTQVGGSVGGVGFLSSDPSVSGGAWQVVKGDPVASDPDTLRGERCYRITADPGNDKQLIAGTTKGLYLKTPNGPWTRITSFAVSDALQPLDVVMTRTAPTKLRIWVATASKVWVAEVTAPATTAIPTNLDFTLVTLPSVAINPNNAAFGTCLQLAAMGNTVYVLGRSAIATTGTHPNPNPAAVWTIDATAGTAGLRGVLLTGTPPDLYMSASDQSGYDMCIAAHPTVGGRIYIGGAAAGTATGWNGAIYRCEIAGTTLTPTLIGEGTHSDVHVLRIGPVSATAAPKRNVWTGTDGGVFRSDIDGDPGSFTACNTGLAALQPGFLANHPTNPGIMAAGLQDNGTAVRIGDGTWREAQKGDGGGVVYDPGASTRYLRQYTGATWSSSDGGSTPPVFRGTAGSTQAITDAIRTSETDEDKASLFYTNATAIAYGNLTHLAVGTNRIWYSTDWGRSWVTLPSATDPRAGVNPNKLQDVLDNSSGSITYQDTSGTTTLASTSSRTVRYSGGIITTRFSQAPNDASGNLKLRLLALYQAGLVWFIGTRAPAGTAPFAWAPGNATIRQRISDPNGGSDDEDAFQHGQPLSFLPALNVTSDFCVHNPALGTLGSCYVTTTGFPYSRQGGPTIDRDTLWFFDGTSTWRPTGLKIDHPNGSWAVAADRVKAPALGVVVDPDNNNVVYVATSVGVVRGELTIGGTQAAPTYHWAWQQMMNGLPEAVVQDVTIFKSGGVKVLRAALQSRGVWEVDLTNVTTAPLSYLRAYNTDTRRIRPVVIGGPATSGDASGVRHDNSPDAVIDVSGTAPAVPLSEADLLKIASAALPSLHPETSFETSQRVFDVHVLAHHRLGTVTPFPANQLRIALLCKQFAADGSVQLDGVWDTLVNGTALPASWSRAAADQWLSPTAPVDPRLPHAVTFHVDMTGKSGAWLLLAVVSHSSNPITGNDLKPDGATGADAVNVQDLVSNSPRAAARSVFLS